jgi:hypothetical protein
MTAVQPVLCWTSILCCPMLLLHDALADVLRRRWLGVKQGSTSHLLYTFRVHDHLGWNGWVVGLVLSMLLQDGG